MTWVKICGMTNLEDALTAVEAGADAVGFVFYKKSPRNVTVDAAREIVEKLPTSVEKIGVFVQGDGVDPMNVMFEVGLTGTQSYSSAECSQYGNSLKAVRASRLPSQTRFLTALPMSLVGEDPQQLRDLTAVFAEWREKLDEASPAGGRLLGTFVLDSGDLRAPGGTGKTFDWRRAVPIAEAMRRGGVKLVVAGGLTAENVSKAIGILKPWGVDVASGVEARPGKKDPEKVRAFVKAVRDADRKAS
jgi:phosphoribosylanthranilate isomerase